MYEAVTIAAFLKGKIASSNTTCPEIIMCPDTDQSSGNHSVAKGNQETHREQNGAVEGTLG
jgi:hypothetical protein